MADSVLLVATDHPPWSERLATAVVDIEEPDTTVEVLYVFDDDDLEATQKNLNLDGRVVDQSKLAKRKETVLEATRVLEEAGFPVEVIGTVGEDQADTILETAGDQYSDRIYLYSKRRNPVGKAVFGSVLQDVLRWSAVPVIVVPEGSL